MAESADLFVTCLISSVLSLSEFEAVYEYSTYVLLSQWLCAVNLIQ